MQVSTEARDVSCPGSGVTGGCELPDLGPGTQAQVLFKGSSCFQSLHHLSSTFFKLCYNICSQILKEQRKEKLQRLTLMSAMLCELDTLRVGTRKDP